MIRWENVTQLEIPDGKVKEIAIDAARIWKRAINNLVRTSIDTDGSIYNGKGYADNTRLNSSGATTTSSAGGTCVSGFIPYRAGGVICAKGSTAAVGVSGHYVACYDANFNCIKSGTSSSIAAYAKYGSYVQQSDGQYLLTVTNLPLYLSENYGISADNIAYIRVSMPQCSGADLIVTINEPIE